MVENDIGDWESNFVPCALRWSALRIVISESEFLESESELRSTFEGGWRTALPSRPESMDNGL